MANLVESSGIPPVSGCLCNNNVTIQQKGLTQRICHLFFRILYTYFTLFVSFLVSCSGKFLLLRPIITGNFLPGLCISPMPTSRAADLFLSS